MLRESSFWHVQGILLKKCGKKFDSENSQNLHAFSLYNAGGAPNYSHIPGYETFHRCGTATSARPETAP